MEVKGSLDVMKDRARGMKEDRDNECKENIPATNCKSDSREMDIYEQEGNQTQHPFPRLQHNSSDAMKQRKESQA